MNNSFAAMQNPVNSLDNRQGYADLRRAAQSNSPEGIKKVAKQFESIFISMMLKEMRNSLPDDSMFASEQQKQFTQMFDQQLAQNISEGQGIGLAKSIERQLLAQVGGNQKATPGFKPLNPVESKPMMPLKQDQVPLELAPIKVSDFKPLSDVSKQIGDSVPAHVRDFVKGILPAAKKAANELKVDVKAVIAQAALETGWGRYVAKNEDGNSSHNYFGIKAHRNWNGDQVDVKTTEFEHGRALKKIEPFRAYQTPEQSFSDYVQFLISSPRYQSAIGAGENIGAFAESLQKAGYATDPRYAEKIESIANGEPLNNALQELKVSANQPTTNTGAERPVGV